MMEGFACFWDGHLSVRQGSILIVSVLLLLMAQMDCSPDGGVGGRTPSNQGFDCLTRLTPLLEFESFLAELYGLRHHPFLPFPASH